MEEKTGRCIRFFQDTEPDALGGIFACAGGAVFSETRE